MRACGCGGMAKRASRGREASRRAGIIASAKHAAQLRLTAARSGNLSCRLDAKRILITATGSSLGALRSDEIIKVNLYSTAEARNPRLTSEFPLHRLIYLHHANNVILHCHPPLANAYFAVFSNLKVLTFESKMCLGHVPVVRQDTPTVTKPEAAVEALRKSNLVVLKNHGVVAVADTFRDALFLIETLEEAVRTVAVARLFKKDLLDGLDGALRPTLVRS